MNDATNPGARTSAIPILPGLAAIAPRYDGFILDVWGVLHNGIEPYPGVIDALARLQAAGKRVVVLSNAPARAGAVRERLRKIGIPDDLYGHLMTSGEEVWQSLRDRTEPFYAGLGRACLHFGPERDKHMLEGLDLDEVRSPEAADFVLNTGPGGWEETVASFESRLVAARAHDLPMICANPDLMVMQGDREVTCAGALAKRYEALGGTVRWHGKPYRSVYETCSRLLGISDAGRILAVGDSLRTDIAGAAGVGIDALLVAGGIHAAELGFDPARDLDPSGLAAIPIDGPIPKAVIGRLIW